MMAAIASSALAEERMVEVAAGVQLRVVDQGGALPGPAVVFIPGWGMTADVWDDQMRRLEAGRRVISFDPRSQGRSTITAYGVTPEQRARDLDVLLGKLGIGSAVLVGWSQGVQDVAAYVMQFGTGRVAGVVLVDSAISDGAAAAVRDPQGTAGGLRMLNIFLAHHEDYARGMVDAIFKAEMPAERKERLVQGVLATPPAIGAAALLADLYGPDRTPVTAKLTGPTLVVASSASPELERQRAVAADLKHGRFELIEQAGHGVFVDQPDRFAAILRDFIDALR